MKPENRPAVDWKDAEAYAPLLEAERSVFAWEWLRRDPGYCAAARQALGGAGLTCRPQEPELWGLHAFVSPELGPSDARPVWSAKLHTSVLPAVAEGAAAPSDAFDLTRWKSLATLVGAAAGREHLLLSDGLRTIRVDILAGSVGGGPVQLRYLLAGFTSAEKPLLTLRRLLALRESGRFARSLHRRETRARRWLLALRTFDALAAGAHQREIATLLLSADASEPRWRSSASSVRSQAQRLVRIAGRMVAGAYRQLLR